MKRECAIILINFQAHLYRMVKTKVKLGKTQKTQKVRVLRLEF
jgi:hypothetical protein